jgi:pyridoxamine 5'-phosphate oxidase
MFTSTMECINKNGKLYNLSAIEEDCWLRMMNGVLQSRNPFHHPVVANANAIGVNMRTVVLRDACSTEKTLCFFTDIRTGKWAELQQDQTISWLFYDREAHIQIRASGKASLHQNDELANHAWDNINPSSSKNYSSMLSPSSEIIHPLDSIQEDLVMPAKKNETGRENFGVVVSKVLWVEWLWLNPPCHFKANFIYDKEGEFTANWLVP